MDNDSFFSKAQVRFLIITFVGAVVAGIGYWQWPQRDYHAGDDVPVSILIGQIIDEAQHIRLDFETLKTRVDRMNTLQQIVLERWRVQQKLNVDTNERLDRQERK